MSDMEKTIELEVNPYDRLVEDAGEQVVPKPVAQEPEVQVQNGSQAASTLPASSPSGATASPIAASAAQNMQALSYRMPAKPAEIIPLSDRAVYRTMDTREYGNSYSMTIELEEDMLVPDTEPDMEMILNGEASIDSITFTLEGSEGAGNSGGASRSENISNSEGTVRGEAALELLYHSGPSYNGKIFVLKNKVPFKREWKENFSEDVQVEVSGRVKSTECRIINERKYRAKISMEITAQEVVNRQRKIFENIQDEELEFLREKASILNVAFTKNKESEINEKLLINNEKIRPLQVLKSHFTVAENHRQLTSDKLVVNETIWVQILYTAEIASQGNLSSQPMMFTGKIDNTQFIPLDDRSNISGCRVSSDVNGLTADVNEEANGFTVSGTIRTKADFFSLMEQEIVADFYNINDDMACDNKEEPVCCGMETKISGQTLRETIEMQEGTPAPGRIIYMNGNVMDYEINESGRQVVITGKIQVEVLMAADEGSSAVARKICEFSQTVDMPEAGSYVAGSRIFVRELTGDITGGQQVNMMIQLQFELDICHEGHVKIITNPCIIREEGRERSYPLVLYTVKENDTFWDIAKRYRVPVDQLIKINGAESLNPGMKIVVAK